MFSALSPKIQRLVTPIRLQSRRHLRSLKRRKLERKKANSSESQRSRFCPLADFVARSALLAKRVAEKKAKVAAYKASHHKCVFSVFFL